MNQTSSPPTRQVGPIRGTGETCNAAEAATRSTAELQAPNVGPGGNCTHDLVGVNEETDLFTTGSEMALSGNGRERAKPSSSQSLRQGLALGARDTTIFAGSPPRYDACAGWIRTSFIQSEVSALFTTDKLYSGEQATRPFCRRTPHLHHLN
jgi:hypothetical protein